MDRKEDPKLFDNIKKIFREHKNKESLLRKVRSLLFIKETNYRIDFNVIVPELQNRLENIFDRIIRCYIRSKQKDEDLYDAEIVKNLNNIKNALTPEEVRHHIVFSLGFFEKKLLVYKLFKLAKHTKKCHFQIYLKDLRIDTKKDQQIGRRNAFLFQLKKSKITIMI